MKTLYIVKVGDTFSSDRAEMGDFEHWIMRGLKRPAEVVDPRHGQVLPAHDQVAGVVVTGSHAMVTDRASWSDETSQWLVKLVEERVPVLGICYGHQLLAQALGGTVDYHPDGMELGTVEIELSAAATTDALFSGLPPVFPAQVTHSQTVVRLPPQAVLLAGNAFEPHQAFRVGTNAWGVQFHPEFSADNTRAYIDKLAPSLQEKQIDSAKLEMNVSETPEAASLLEKFGCLCSE